MNLIEWCRPIENELVFYTLENAGKFYLLDTDFALVKQIVSIAFPSPMHLFRMSTYRNFPVCKNIAILEAKLGLRNLRQYLQTLYVKNPLDAMFLGLPPPAELAIPLYNLVKHIDTLLVDANVCWQWIFAVAQKQKKRETVYPTKPNVFFAGCVWKGFFKLRRRDNVESLLYEPEFENVEGQVIDMLRMARNKPRGSNVFAQFNKDVFNHILVPMIRFTLPFEIN